ncbi:MAG: tetratricopeptide repeat protein [Deltaproteobacteria bacterium]|nr:tetratricopeptide repeat protein [Deltaproteobacteria bacterium]
MKALRAKRSVPFLFFVTTLFFFSGSAPAGDRAGQKNVGASPIRPGQTGTGVAQEASVEEIPDWKARWELARLLSYVKRYEESLAEYGKLIRERPDLLEAKVEMAGVYTWKGEPDKAFEILNPIPLERIPEDKRIVLADLYTARKEYGKAEPIYRRHLERNPEDLKARLRLAEILSWTRRYQDSLSQYEMILKARPDDIQVRRKYAFVLSWSGRHADAIAELRRTLP